MARQPKKKPTTRQRRKILRPKTRNQEHYMGQINKSDVTFCSGPAGSGKTSVSVGMACEYLIEKKVDKIIITRPVVESKIHLHLYSLKNLRDSNAQHLTYV